MIKGKLDTNVFFMRSIEDQEVVFWDYFFLFFLIFQLIFQLLDSQTLVKKRHYKYTSVVS